MKKITLVLLTIALSSNLFGQRYCGSHLNLIEIQQTDPARYKRITETEYQLQQMLIQKSGNTPTSTITIPVVIHVVYNNSRQNISDAQINAQIQVLNNDFRRLNSDRTNTPNAFASVAGDANIKFVLAKLDPNGNATSGITRTPTNVSGFSHSTNNVKYTSTGGHDAWNTKRYLNIWVCNFSDQGLMGYAQFPFDLESRPKTDGVVISYKYFGVNTLSSTQNFSGQPSHTSNQTETYSVKLLDASGVVLRQAQFNHSYGSNKPQPVKFNVVSLRRGTYFLHVEGGGELIREQIMVN